MTSTGETSMQPQSSRHAACAWIAALILLTGCPAAMPQARSPANGNAATPTPWPLTFKGPHSFAAYCYNTQRCRVIYNNHLFTRAALDAPTPEPRSDYRDHWHAGYIVPCDDGFPPPATVEWTARDGTVLDAQVDIDAIFKDRRILHKVPREEIPDGWRPYWYGAGGPSIYLEVNDRTINVYMQELIATKTPQIPGNPRSTGRTDVMLAWTHTY